MVDIETSAMTESLPWNAPHTTGTTIMACEYDGGVVIGADSRSSTGMFVSNRFSDKLTKLTDFIYCCRSGASADTQAISDIVKYHLNFHKMELGEEPLVEAAANLLRELCYTYRDTLTAGMIVAGWDSKKGGQIYSIPIGGMCTRQKITIGGSGSTYIYGFVDYNYKPSMNREQAVKFIHDAISLAIVRDGSSGGVVRYAVITDKGVDRGTYLNDELPKYYDH